MDRSELLKPFVPRLVVDWLRHAPEDPYRRVDGSLAFVDISGFTSMTERLARKGKVGAEEMNDVLDALFTELLAVAYDDGAGLVKWGGDAVLLLFDGEDHAPRACRAAVNMQATIRRVGKITTSVGHVRLRMSIGIHSGPFDFFLVGDPEIHRELVIVGPSSTETVRMEQIAEAGEVVVSAATASMIDPDSVGKPKEDALLLRFKSQVPFQPARPGPDIRGIDLEQLVPVAIREYLLTEETQPEHRRITAGFLEFAGTDDFLASRGPAETALALDTCVRAVQRAALQHGVGFFETDVAKNAFRVMLIVGAPSSGGGDEDRMLGTLRSVAEAELPIPMRAGTNAGHVFSGYFGPQFRKTYSIKGDAVNTAARVMAKAEPGQILATSSVLDAATALYDLHAIEPFAAKGKRYPIQAWTVGPRTGTKGEIVDLPLVGRDAQIADVRAAIDQARDGSGRLLEIVGPAGIGKSRLLAELLHLASEFPVLRVQCEPYQQGVAYRSFRTILRQALDLPKDAGPVPTVTRLRESVASSVPDLEPWLPLLAGVLDVDMPITDEVAGLGEEFRGQRLEETSVALLRALLGQPVLFAVEDAHWMDAGSAGILARLAREMSSLPWILAVTRREEATGFVAPEAETTIPIELEPLQPAHAEELLVTASEDSPLRPGDLAILAERSAGNPLFLLELLNGLRSAGNVEDLPRSVEDLVTAQIDRLVPADRRLLRFAAVLGASFTDELVDALTTSAGGSLDPRAWARLSEFLAEEGPGKRRFRHALIRDAAYEGLPYKRRRTLHALAGDLIVGRSGESPDEQADLLSLHFLYAERYEDAWRYSRIAGDQAWSKYAILEASECYARALMAARHLPESPAEELAGVHRSLAEAKWKMGRFEEASFSYRAARKLLADRPLEVSELLLKEAAVNERLGRYTQALRAATRARKALGEATDPDAERQVSRASVEYATNLQIQGRNELSIRWSERAIAEASVSQDQEVIGQANLIIGYAHMNLGLPDADDYYRRALAAFEAIDDRPGQALVLNNLGVTAYYAGRWTDAVDLWRRSTDMRHQLGDVVNEAYGLVNVGEVEADQGRLDEAERLFRTSLRIWRSAGFEWGVAYATMNIGRTRCRRGDVEAGIESLREAAERMRVLGASADVIEAEARVAEGLMVATRAEEALSVVARLLDADEMSGDAVQVPLLERVRGYAYLQLGEPIEAREAFERSLRLARDRDLPYERALTQRAIVALLGALGDRVDLSLVEESDRTLSDLGVEALAEVPLGASGTSVVATNA